MANLIITVISIALVAVAALMGAYYGGSAFMDGQAKAKANEVANAFQQVDADAAIQIYNAQNNTILQGLHSTNAADLSPLVPNYLPAIPKPSVTSGAGDGVSLSWYSGWLHDVLMLTFSNANVCRQLEAMRTGTLAPLRDSDYSIYGNIGCYSVGSTNYAYYTLYGSP